MNEPTVSRWAWATLAASLATCGLTVTQVLVVCRRIDALERDDLPGLILAGLVATVVLCLVAWIKIDVAEGRLSGRWLAGLYAAGAFALVIGLWQFFPLFEWVGRNRRTQDVSCVKQIVLAIHNYAGHNGDKMPGPAICAPDGTPLLSWRVAILPFIDQQKLYDQFHLDEPWDSPHNLALLPRMPVTYRHHRLGRSAPRDKTFFQVFVGP